MSIEEQIEALTQELRPYPDFRRIKFWTFDGSKITTIADSPMTIEWVWINQFCASSEAEVEEYADCYRRLKLYQLLGKKAEKEFPLDWSWSNGDGLKVKFGTDFQRGSEKYYGMIQTQTQKHCSFGSVWFSREEDRLEALKLAGIDKLFQEKCAKYGLGGA